MSGLRPLCLFPLLGLLAATTGHAGDAPGNAARGQQLFMTKACTTCHGVTPDDTSKVGPNLVGVLGRKAWSKPSLLGSENLRKYGVIWSAETLDEFLVNPSAKAPGTAMAGILVDPQERADVIAYLWLVPPPGAPVPLSPGDTSFTHSEPLAL